MSTQAQCFTFGDPVPVLSRYEFLYCGCWQYGSKWYEPPFDMDALAKLYRATAHHGSAIQAKRNILVKTFEPSQWLSRSDFKSLALDFLVFGNCYGEKIKNRGGKLLKFKPALARYMRRGMDLDNYFWVTCFEGEQEFPEGAIVHMMEPSINQEVYGEPDYLGALQSLQLNESATLFRRRYYENGSHAGFILYMTDAAQKQEDIDNLREALKNAKGPGNFRNLFMYAPNGKKDGIQLLPVSEVAAKDEFLNIKNLSRDDQLASHRVPPQLMGIMPNNTGGFGDVEKAARVFAANELEPIQQQFLELNEQIGEEVFRFKDYSLGGEK
jgi:PBSX family phage portal protein